MAYAMEYNGACFPYSYRNTVLDNQSSRFQNVIFSRLHIIRTCQRYVRKPYYFVEWCQTMKNVSQKILNFMRST